ncbi:hypothetical protein RCL1_001565 [Eukaryota sp. TZLM3-RCL]
MSLTDVQTYLENKIEHLTNLLRWRTLSLSPTDSSQFCDQLSDLETALREILQVPQELDSITSVLEPLRQYALKQKDYIDLLESKLPNSLKSRPQTAPEPLAPQPMSSTNLPVANQSISERPSTSQSDTRGSAVSQIPFISQDMLDRVPQYLRGRLTVDKINKSIEDINAMVKRKYVYAKKAAIRSGIKPSLIKIENKNSFVLMDLKESVNIRPDPKGKQVLDVLRAIKLIDEVREDGADCSSFVIL